MAFDLVQMVYWLTLAGWFGLVLFVAMATPIIVRTVLDADPTLPTVLSVNLDRQHSGLLAMTIIADLLTRLAYVQLVCAGGLLLGLIGQWFFVDYNSSQIVLAVLRTALYLAAAGLLLYGWIAVWPRFMRQRQKYVEVADDPEAAETARTELQKTQREGEIVQLLIATILSAMILFSAGIGKATVIQFK